MKKTASLNAAPKNGDGKGEVNRRCAHHSNVDKFAGVINATAFGAGAGLAVIYLVLGSASAHTAGSGMEPGTNVGTTVPIRHLGGGEVGDMGCVCFSYFSINQVLDNFIQASGPATFGVHSVGSSPIIDNSVTTAGIANAKIQNQDLAEGALNFPAFENGLARLKEPNSEVRWYTDNFIAKGLNPANNHIDCRQSKLDSKIDREADTANGGVTVALAAQVPTLADGTVQAITLGYGSCSGSLAFSTAGTAQIEDASSQILGNAWCGHRAGKIGLSIGFWRIRQRIHDLVPAFDFLPRRGSAKSACKKNYARKISNLT